MTTNHPIFHIGLHKTGSSFLQQELFGKNSKLFHIVKRKEIQEHLIYHTELSYNPEFTNKIIQNIIENSDKEGKIPVFSEERLSGLPHEGGSDSLIIGRRIKDAAPNAKIILIIREQKSMINSAYGQYIIGYGSCSIKEYLNPSTKKRSNLFNSSFLEYDKLINFYFKKFGKENVLVLPFEMLKNNNTYFINNLIDFIGLDTPEKIINKINFKPANSSQYDFYLHVKRYLNPFILNGHKNLGRTLYFYPLTFILNLFLKFLRRVNIPFFNKKIKYKKMKIINSFVNNKYNNSNKRTSELINIDLKKYGYDM